MNIWAYLVCLFQPQAPLINRIGDNLVGAGAAAMLFYGPEKGGITDCGKADKRLSVMFPFSFLTNPDSRFTD